MNYRRSERVGAFIIRKNAASVYELLVFRHRGMEAVPIDIPGGGIEAGETIEAALHREIFEESGLQNLPILRKVGALQRCWLDTHNVACRHYFLLEAPAHTPDTWEHIVHGKGEDAGLCFVYSWQRPTPAIAPAASWTIFLNTHYLPELYG